MTSTMSSPTVCADFVQNAWKKDLCSNCFRTRADHFECGLISDSASLTSVGDAHHHQHHNGFGKAKMKPNKNHVSGVQLWEIGSSGSVKVQLSSSDYRPSDVKGILKAKLKAVKNFKNHNNSHGSDSNGNGARRSSVVGFAEDMPMVIGYGGGDYEWDEDEDSSDDPSDVDSLENFDLSLEEKAFTELTDTNTQYNAENLSILQLDSYQNQSTGTNGNNEKEVSVSQPPPPSMASSSPSTTTTTPASTPSPTVFNKDFNSINEARNFICSNLYGAGEDVETTLNEAESEIIVRRESELAKVLIKAGCDTAPSSTGRRHVVRPSVKDYFTKEEPVTAADFAAVAEKCHSTITKLGTNGVCSPYGIVSVTSVNTDMDVPPSNPPPSVPTTLPTDTINASGKRSPNCSNKIEFEEGAETVEELRANRENVVRSCHYASANVSNGVATPPLVSGNKNDPSSRQQTPLTSPYSSTAILKGIPSNLSPDDFSYKTKPPVLKPKPKIPSKPCLAASPTSAEPPPSKQDTIVAGCDSPSIGIQNRDSSFEMNKYSGQGSINLGKRPSKRPAPRPPTDLPLLHNNNATMSAEEAKITSPTDEQFEQFETKMSVAESVENVNNSYEMTSPTSVKSLSSVSSPVLIEEPVSYGVPTPISPTSTVNNTPTFQDHSKDSKDIKVKKSKFSLKKLLKFGSAKEDHNLEQRRLKSERRSKLEIIHPIDLIQSSRTDLANVSSLPSLSPDSPYGTNGSSSDRPVLTKMTTFSSPPVSPGWSSTATNENGHSITSTLTERAQSQEIANNSGLTHEAETQSNASSNFKNKDVELANGNTKVNENGIKSNKEPKPPPRSRYIDTHNSANKDKPMRPPPPTKVQENNESNGVDEQEKENKALVEETYYDEESINGKDDKNINGFMDYANLGDIRTSLAPRKPGRWPSGDVMELPEDTNAQNNYEDHYDHIQATPQSTKVQALDVTYYAPPVELDELSQEELYADQAVVLRSSDGHSSLTSNSTSSSHSNDAYNNENNSKTSKIEITNGGKIYERVVLKRNGLEKVYSSSPTAMSSIESSNGGGQMYESDEMSDISSLWPRRVSSRLSLRKIKTVVHKNLEDNYGAVVAANHQTLTQISEQVALTHHVKASKAKILENVNLNWSDFQLLEDSQVTVVGQKAFYSAIFKQQNLETTLMVTRKNVSSPTQPIRNPCVLAPLAEFQSVIPGTYFAESDQNDTAFDHQGTVWVMDRMRVETIFNMAENLQIQRENDPETCEREVSFILLQLINGLKHLQMLGIEEIETDLSDFLLVMSNNEVNHRLVILPKSSTVMDAYQSPPTSAQEKFSLGQGALEVMRLLFQEPSVDTLTSLNDGFGLIAEILNQEKADSLSQAKRLLEYVLWGPTNLNSLDFRVAENNKVVPIMDQEQTFQRWLDLERANVLNNLIRTQSLWQIRLTIFEEYMLSFFVRTSAKLLRESSNQLQINTRKFT